MIHINPNYFAIILLFIGIFTCYTSSKFFNLSIKEMIVPMLFHCFIISVMFLLVIINKLNLLYFSLYLAILCIVLYTFSSNKNFKCLLFSLKSYYVFLLSFIITFSLFELIFKENIYILMNSRSKLILLFLISTILYLSCEIWFLNNLDMDRFNYVLSSINIFIPISMFVMLLGKNYSFFYILIFSKHSYLISTVFLTSTLLEIYFGIFIVIAISKSYNLSIYKHKTEILNMQYELQVNNLNQLEEYQSDIRRISHDIHNHKIVIYNLIKDKEYDKALGYLESFGSGFMDTEYELFTNHKILNALFLKKKSICITNNIRLTIDVDIPSSIGISDFDLCIIIGNLVDNAIEACEKIIVPNTPYIDIKAKIINDNFIFELKNNFNGNIKKNKSKVITSKKDTLNHGLGLSNVKSTVDKYDGICELSFKDDEFTSLIIIPLN